MSAARIHRYIAREVAVPTLLGLLVFTFVLLMGRLLKLVELVVNKGVPAGEVGRLFLCLLPTFLVLTIPMAFLLGVLLGFGRLSADSEVVALKACGVSLYGMLLPVLLLGAAASLATALLTLYAEPSGNAAFRSQLFQIASSQASSGFQPRIFNDDFDGLVLYAAGQDEQDGTLQGVFISDERVGSTPAIILARSGRIVSDRNALTLTLRLEDGSIHRQPDDGLHDSYQLVRFATYDVNLNLGQQLSENQQRRKRENELSATELRQALTQAPPGEERSKLAVEWHRRLALPVTPLLFALVGVPLGVRCQRSGRGGGFASALAVFLLYYVLFSFAETLAVKKGVPVAAAIWAPTVLLLAGGFFLLHLAAQEKPLLPRAAERLRRLVPRMRGRR